MKHCSKSASMTLGRTLASIGTTRPYRTSWIQTAVISCKTTAIKRERIYEVLYLVQRFSLSSKAAIIYTQNRFATEDAPKGFDSQQNMIPLPNAERQRIRAIGVELIRLDELGEQTLGSALEKLFDRDRCR